MKLLKQICREFQSEVFQSFVSTHNFEITNKGESLNSCTGNETKHIQVYFHEHYHKHPYAIISTADELIAFKACLIILVVYYRNDLSNILRPGQRIYKQIQ